MDRIKHLRAELHRHNHYYYVLDRPVISDAEFDAMLRELIELEKKHNSFDPNSPSVRVGAGFTEGFEKVKHTTPMLSLDNTFNAEEVVAFFRSSGVPAGTAMIVEPKIDGLSLELRYVDGVLVKAVTRGDGSEGDDVTLNARTIRTIPLVLAEPVTMNVRGEVYLRKSVFNKLNEQRQAEGEDLFANPRNAASGSMKQRDPAEVAHRKLDFIAYFIVGQTHVGFGTRHRDFLAALQRFGFKTPLDYKVHGFTTSDNTEEIGRIITFLDRDRKELDWDTDGLVFKLDNLDLQRELGLRTKSPRWAVAFKYPPEQARTILQGVTVQIGRTGALTPVAELKSVHLGGSTVKRASLCNQDEVERLGINIGDEVIVVKAAEIIPKIIGLGKKNAVGNWKMPATCPCCGTPVEKDPMFVAYYCPNKDCTEQVYQRLEHAVAKSSLDMDGCGEALIREAMAAGVKDLAGLFELDPNKISGNSARMKFIKAREAAKAQPLWRKLHALGAEGVGRSLCKELANRWRSLEEICTQRTMDIKTVLGEVKSQSFLDCILANADMIERLDALGFKFEDAERKTGPLTGKLFCITGGLMTGSRDQVSKKIEDAGGIVKGSVSKGVHFLIMGEGAGATKQKAAEKLGTKVITEEELYQMLGQPMSVAAVDVSQMDF